MMKWIARLMIAGMMVAGSAPAHAADWWWVEGDSADDVALFVDADSVVRDNADVRFHVQKVDRDGRSATIVQRVRCDDQAVASDKAAMRRFACASVDERMEFAANLGSIVPREAAQAIFATSAPAPAASGITS